MRAAILKLARCFVYWDRSRLNASVGLKSHPKFRTMHISVRLSEAFTRHEYPKRIIECGREVEIYDKADADRIIDHRQGAARLLGQTLGPIRPQTAQTTGVEFSTGVWGNLPTALTGIGEVKVP